MTDQDYNEAVVLALLGAEDDEHRTSIVESLGEPVETKSLLAATCPRCNGPVTSNGSDVWCRTAPCDWSQGSGAFAKSLTGYEIKAMPGSDPLLAKVADAEEKGLIPERVRNAVAKVKAWLMAKLKARYGDRAAGIIAKVALLSAPVPIPGSQPAAVALSLLVAEVAKLAGAIGPSKSTGPRDEVVVRELLTEARRMLERELSHKDMNADGIKAKKRDPKAYLNPRPQGGQRLVRIKASKNVHWPEGYVQSVVDPFGIVNPASSRDAAPIYYLDRAFDMIQLHKKNGNHYGLWAEEIGEEEYNERGYKNLSSLDATRGGALMPPPTFPGPRPRKQINPPRLKWLAKTRGAPCQQGEAASRTGCIPASGDSGSQGEKPDEGTTNDQARPTRSKPTATRGDMAEARREGKGKEAKVVLADGSPAPAHIKPSMVPPDWTGVQVSLDPEADLLVKARDSKGRVKSVYSEAFHMRNAARKFARVDEMIRKGPEIDAQIQEARKDPATRDVADCAWLMATQATRPGKNANTGADVKAYGATTLEGRHVVKVKDGVRLRFVGKGGLTHDHLVRDPELAKMLLERKEAAGHKGRLFGKVNEVRVNDFIGSLDGGGFSAKDFRTRRANLLAVEAMKKWGAPPTTQKEYKARVKEVAEKVSHVLGNRPAQALESYINPAVFSTWRVAE